MIHIQTKRAIVLFSEQYGAATWGLAGSIKPWSKLLYIIYGKETIRIWGPDNLPLGFPTSFLRQGRLLFFLGGGLLYFQKQWKLLLLLLSITCPYIILKSPQQSIFLNGNIFLWEAKKTAKHQKYDITVKYSIIYTKMH